MRPFALVQIALGVLLLASCDTAEPEGFSLEVSVQDEAGRPVAGREVALLYGTLGTGRPPASQRASALSVSPVYPTPWDRVAQVAMHLDEASRVRVDLVDLDGTVVATPFEGPLPAGSSAVALSDELASGETLPAGVYRVRVTAGADVQTQTTIHSDAVDGDAVGRLLGVTAADGTLATSDRTAAPALYGVAPVPVSDEFGNPLGTFTFREPVSVVVLSADGGVAGRAETSLGDGRNRVSVRLGRP